MVLCNEMLLHGKEAPRPSPAWPGLAWPQPLPACGLEDGRNKGSWVFPLAAPSLPPSFMPGSVPLHKLS